MYTVSVTKSFDAAHHLVGYRGNCANVHGHRWDVRVTIEGEELNELGMLIDFKIVKEQLSKFISRFDHHDLNTISPFDTTNPTAENLVILVWRELLVSSLGVMDVRLERLRLWETDTAWVELRRE